MKDGRRRESVTLKPVFVETIPIDSRKLVEGNLYISLKYDTIVHRCPCGCGGLSEVTLHPARRRLFYDGEYVSIEPSIGATSLKCRSHYWITRNRILWDLPIEERQDEWYDRRRRRLMMAYEGRPIVRNRTNRRWWSKLWYWIPRTRAGQMLYRKFDRQHKRRPCLRAPCRKPPNRRSV